jgi:hypothetical protein
MNMLENRGMLEQQKIDICYKAYKRPLIYKQNILMSDKGDPSGIMSI